jgi:dephospho-CoA kinase
MRIGVTGIFASGKGTVCKMFEELGANVIDTDELARKVVEPGSEGLREIVREFGSGVLKSDGTLNRQAVADIVFKDADKVKKLNNITHPLILNRITELTNKSPDEIFIINVPLLFEGSIYKLMDYNITVTAQVEQAIERGVKRDNIPEKAIKERLNHQISLKEKIKLSDYVIDNSGSVLNTKRQVLEIWTILHQKRKGD